MSENKGPRMIKGDYNPSFYLKHMKKDLSLVMDLAEDNDITLPITNSVYIYLIMLQNGISKS
jgi:3-hydroxyisobutyrate dehydrogenase